MLPSYGLFWLVEAPLSELYEKKLHDKLTWNKQMKEAKANQLKSKSRKTNRGLNLKKRLAAASAEANSEYMCKTLSDEKKLRKLQEKLAEKDKKNKLKLMKDLARSTEVLVASLKSDGVDIEEYFREAELDERREAWMRDFGDLQVVEEAPTERSYATTVEENDEADAMRVESEIERRNRLRREEREARDDLENTLEEREEREMMRVKYLKQQKKDNEKKKERDRKIKNREGKDWILTRKHELEKIDYSKQNAAKKEANERKARFVSYQAKVQKKFGRIKKDKEQEWKRREIKEREKREDWQREDEMKKQKVSREDVFWVHARAVPGTSLVRII